MKLILYISILLLFSCSLKKTNDPLGENAAILKSSTEDEEIFQTVDTSEIQKFNLMNNDEVKAKELKKYIVTKNDTLMLIAFKLFGDINKWGELKKNNPILDKVDLYPGMIFPATGTLAQKEMARRAALPIQEGLFGQFSNAVEKNATAMENTLQQALYKLFGQPSYAAPVSDLLKNR